MKQSNRQIIGLIKALKDFRGQIKSTFHIDNPESFGIVGGEEILHEGPKGAIVAVRDVADIKKFGEFEGAYTAADAHEVLQGRDEDTPLIMYLPYTDDESYEGKLSLHRNIIGFVPEFLPGQGKVVESVRMLILEVAEQSVEAAVMLVENGLLYGDYPKKAWDNPDFLKAMWDSGDWDSWVSVANCLSKEQWTDELCEKFMEDGDPHELPGGELKAFIDNNPEMKRRITHAEMGSDAMEAYDGWEDTLETPSL